MEVPQKLNIELPYDPAVPLLGRYTEGMTTLIQKDSCAPTFTGGASIKASACECRRPKR